MRIAFTVIGEPKGQPRARAFARKFGNKHSARMYDPGTADGWKQAVALASMPHRQREPITGPIIVSVTFFMPRPKSLCRKKDPDGVIPHTAKPDVDNLIKALFDALTDAGMWRDDAQVYETSVRKYYHGKGGVACCHVEIEFEETP
jgi:Holliday junction resolvase RusA-like endonuclease